MNHPQEFIERLPKTRLFRVLAAVGLYLMPKPRHLNSAPITEAIFDVRVKARAGFDVRDFSKLKSVLAQRFPKVDPQQGGKVTFQISLKDAQPPILEDLGLQGFFYKTDDEKLIAQFRIDGFTLNKLKPYSSWEELLPVAVELWGLYAAIALPETVTRIALRYINYIPLPPALKNFETYLRAAPVVPPELPQSVSAFFSRVTIVEPNEPLAAHIVQVLETNPTNQGVTLILDIDSFCEVDISPHELNLTSVFSRLHDFKNMIFFNYLTEETLRLFE